MIETIRLSEKAKTQLIALKRRTGIQHWNVLCRWALCLSLAEPTKPPDENIPSDSSVEMSWRTFSGGHDEIYRSIFLCRAIDDGVPTKPSALQQYFRLHLHRGISYLSTRDLTSIVDLLRLAASKRARGKVREVA